MKIGMQTWGSDGDILPFMALAAGLSAAGHQVTIAYTSVDHKNYESYAEQGGFKSIKVFGEFAAGMHEALGDIIQTNDPLKQFILVMETYFDPAVDAMYEASHALCEENELVIGHMMNHTLLTAADKFKRPRVSVALAPLAIRTRHIPLFGPNFGPFFNCLTWQLGDYIGRKKLFSKAADIRQREGLPPLRSLQQQLYVSKELTLLASSAALTPRQSDWGPHIQICGDMNYENPALYIHMPEGLDEFIAAGPPPIYVSFGSLGPYQCEAVDHLIVEAIEEVGCRAIIQSPWEGKSASNIFRCLRAPHAQVFPRCAAVIHHGGAGTTHSALRAGCPSIVVEHAFDQQYWGSELQKRGVAGKVLHRNSLTADQLIQAIRNILNSDAMTAKAKILGKQMQSENGVRRAVVLIEELAKAKNLI